MNNSIGPTRIYRVVWVDLKWIVVDGGCCFWILILITDINI